MSRWPRFGALCLAPVLPVLMSGCGREERLLTAVTPPKDFVAAPTPPDALDANKLQTTRGNRHLPPPVLIAEAKEALTAVLTGEQWHYQNWITFTDVPDTADFRVVLGVYFGDLLDRWAFSVRDASTTGFLAEARGRDDTDAERIIVTLRYERGQPLVWAVERRRPRR